MHFSVFSNLDYEDFGVFKSDVTTIVFAEHVIDGDSVRYECSCEVGGKGIVGVSTYLPWK